MTEFANVSTDHDVLNDGGIDSLQLGTPNHWNKAQRFWDERYFDIA